MKRFHQIIILIAVLFFGVILGADINNNLVGKEFNWELTLGLLGVCIAVCALYTSYFVAKETIRHNKLSVQPKLTTISHTSADSTIRYELHNGGLGPAVLKEVIVNINGTEFNWTDANEIERCLRHVGIINSVTSYVSVSSGTIIL